MSTMSGKRTLSHSNNLCQNLSLRPALSGRSISRPPLKLTFLTHLRLITGSKKPAEAGLVIWIYSQAAIFLHCSAQWWQALEHSWQWSCSCFPHSSPHFWQTSAQRRQSAWAESLFSVMNWAARRQIFAHCISSFMHSRIISRFSSSRHEAAQLSHAVAHR